MFKFNHDFGSRFRILKGGKISLVVSAMVAGTTLTFASPSDGVVTSGTASISQSGNTTNITQTTDKASINWNKFNIASNETVNFNQPNSSSITLNRVIGNEKSVIDGALNANGQVWILNSNGILFGKNASINTSGLLATTAELSDTDFQNGNYDFKGNSSESVINLGLIEVSNNGSVVLAANEVVNSGTIKAIKGKVHLTAANEYTVNLNGNSLVNLIVNKGVLDAMVENSGTISASGGEIYLTTNAVNELLKGVVNNTGIIEANSLDGLMGKVEVFAHGGEVQVGGTIEAKDGFVETSGKDFTVKENAVVKAKEWLIDPVDITIDATLASTIETALTAGDVTIKTDSPNTSTNVTVSTLNQTSTDADTTDGDIYVNSAITWSSANKLTLDAADSIYINSAITATNGKLALYYGDSGDYNVNAKVNLSAGANFFTKKGTTATNWTVVTTAGDTQGMSKTGNTVLGADVVDASSIANWDPIGDATTKFTGKFDGLGHTISNLTINRPTEDYVGLFGYTNGATIQNLKLDSVNVTGNKNVGALVGYAYNTSIKNVSSSGSVTGKASVGGIAGYTDDTVLDKVHTSGSVIATNSESDYSGFSDAGGLIGSMYGNSILKNSYSTVSVKGTGRDIGGAVGYMSGTGSIDKVYATGDVSITAGPQGAIGGLVGGINASGVTISNSYATGNVNVVAGGNLSGTRVGAGSLVGNAKNASISNSYATGVVDGQTSGNTAGLVGIVSAGTSISNSFYNKTVNPSMSDDTARGKTTAEFADASTFSTWWNTDTWSLSSTGGSGEGYDLTFVRPYLTSLGKDATLKASTTLFEGGYGTVLNPYTITNWTQLQNINNSNILTNNYYFNLSNSINNTASGYTSLASSTANSGAGWNPIGLNSTDSFKGTFDGLGNTISDLNINRTTDYIGLFGYTNGATIKNIGLVNVSIKGNNAVGGLIGEDYSSTISNSYASGTVNSTGGTVGGLIGISDSSLIEYSYATGAVSSIGSDGTAGAAAEGYSATYPGGRPVTFATKGDNGGTAGGLIGETKNNVRITNSYASGTVTSTGGTGGASGASGAGGTGAGGTGGTVGGLIGKTNDKVTITNSYASGTVNSVGGIGGTNVGTSVNAVNGTAGTVGGLIGVNNDTSTITNSFYDITKTLTSVTIAGVSGKTTKELSYGQMFKDASWDIVADSTVTSATPIIKYDSVNSKYVWAIAPLDLSYTLSTDQSKTYDGQTKTLSSLYTNVFGSDYSFINAGYKFQVDGSDVTGYRNAGTYENIKVVSNSDFLTIKADNTTSTNKDGKYVISKADISAITGITADNKTYDGKTAATLSTTNAAFTGMIKNDVLNVATKTGTFVDKNVGTGKTVSITDLTLGGTDAANYNLTTATASTSANITRLDSVTWIGGPTGNWFDPSNWANGAVPDLSNVANVVIPTGTVVVFDTTKAVNPADTSAAVNIDSLGTLGSLTMTNGELNILNNMTLDTFVQNGGILTAGSINLDVFNQTAGATTSKGDLTVASEYSQGTLGTVTVLGNTNITDKNGGVVLGNLNTTGTTTITSNNGNITQSTGTALISTGTITLDAGTNDITLDNVNNDFKNTVNVSGKDVALADKNGIELGNVTSTGTLDVNAVDTISQTATSVITAAGIATLASTSGDVILDNANNDFKNTVNVSGKDVALADKNGIELGNVTSTGTLDVKAVDTISQTATSVITAAGIATLASTSGDVILDNVNNDFKNTVNVSGKDVALADKNGIELGNVTSTGTLDVKAVDTISQTVNSVITAAGIATLASTSGNVKLDNANNDFKNTVNVSGKDVALADKNGIELGNVTSTGTLGVKAVDTISQTVNSVITAAGIATLASTNGNVKLDNANNQFKSTVVARGRTVSMSGLPVVEEPKPEKSTNKKIEDTITAITNQTVLRVKIPEVTKASGGQDAQNDMGTNQNIQTAEGNQGPKSLIKIVNGGIAVPLGLAQYVEADKKPDTDPDKKTEN